MKPCAVGIVCGVFFFASAVFAAAGDTTYGNVEIIEKEHKPSSPEKIPQQQHGGHDDNRDDDTGSFTGQVAGCLFQGLVKGLYYAYVKPVILIAGGGQWLESPRNRNSFGMEFGNGFVLYPGVAAGFQLRADISNCYRFGSAGISVTTGLRPAFMGMYKDFQRTVYVDDSLIGVERYETYDYFNFQMPFEAFFHWFPSGERGAFHLYCGGGAAYGYEHLDANRTASYNTAKETLHPGRHSIAPLGAVGIGRIIERNGVPWQFRLEYALTVNSCTRRALVPSDNTPYMHAISLHWGIIF